MLDLIVGQTPLQLTFQDATGLIRPNLRQGSNLDDVLHSWTNASLNCFDLTPILAAPRNPYGQSFHNTKGQDHGLDKALDVELIRQAHDAIVDRLPVACR